MISRLGDVLYWAGCIIAAVLLVAIASNDQIGGGLIAAAIVFAIGWAARYVLSGKRGIF